MAMEGAVDRDVEPALLSIIRFLYVSWTLLDPVVFFFSALIFRFDILALSFFWRVVFLRVIFVHVLFVRCVCSLCLFEQDQQRWDRQSALLWGLLALTCLWCMSAEGNLSMAHH